MNNPAQPASKSANRWPPQIKYIIGNEGCERFSYYGMLSILAGYISGDVLKGGLGKTDDDTTTIIHLFKSVNYFTPLLGAWLSDKIIGRYYTILWVSLLYCLGHGILACSDFAGGVEGKALCLYAGLTCIAFGSGGIKPCVSAFMGDQFKPDQSHLLQKAYGAFYWSINFGSFFSFLVIPWIKNHHGYSLAFLVPGILMGLATFIFWLGTGKYTRVPPARETNSGGFFPVFLHAYAAKKDSSLAPLLNILTALGAPIAVIVGLATVSFAPLTPLVRGIGWATLGLMACWYLSVVVTSLLRKFDAGDTFWSGASGRFSETEVTAARSVSPILFVFALVPVFWSLFDQTNSTWVLQGGRMVNCNLFGFQIGADEMQSMNPLIVMVLVPLFTLGVYPKLGRLASPLRRMSYGMFLASSSYLIVATIQHRIENGAQLNIMWQTVPYLVLTAAEVLISTTGLEFAFREAAPQMKSLIMSFWLLTVTVGNLLVSGVTRMFSGAAGSHGESVTTGRFLMYAGLTFVVAILFSVVAASYQYRDRASAEGR
ncbi:MAG: MFS transporter [Verrucomicrobiota bacterium]